MKIFQSGIIEKVVKEKIDLGLRGHVKKTCSVFHSTGKEQEVLQGMKAAAELCKPGEGPEFAAVIINQGILLYDLAVKTELDWIQELANLEKKVAPLPHKVLVKMAALRIRNLFNGREEHHQRRVHIKNQYNTNPPALIPIPAFPDLISLQAFKDIKEIVGKVFTNQERYEFDKLVNSFEGLLIKGVSDQVLLEGWSLHITKEVMES